MNIDDTFQPERVFTTTQLAEALQISNNQVTTLAQRDNWPHMKVGNRLRFTETHVKEIYELLKAPETRPTEPRRKVGSRSRQSRATY
ncbi:hypothetical protein J2790_004279 [Paenarthrobacter nicotinovorans]|uniref:helix-turn-helix domain-containing protein n=1 Tax=Micrococcaceae TaxID=1268 RepID=UPI00087703FD|nr:MULTISPECIES: helix-turn-helix domain-containing protein [Micrococcaceae]MDR6439104.1 hypothetical protein [Paenarthrobacter nicotinovorans]SCZ65378.1 hypothetical protein SAMN02799638_04168 [Arthrobacter sp. UNCCL28]